MLRRLVRASLGLVLAGAALPAPAGAAPWVADQGDGSYRNPVLHADYSDPDVLRQGDDYWLVASSFSSVPGLPLLHSRDLVNWELRNHALPALVPRDYFSQHRPGQGVWAPSIRWHEGLYYIYYPDPDFGIYCVTATDPAAAWSAPVLVLPGRGLIDPCPLWDRDGRVYLVHAWARSRAGISNLLTLRELTADGLHPAAEGRTIIDANQLAGWTTLEGPKLYRRGDYYYIFAPAGGVTGGYQAVFRSRNLAGPYENRIVLAQGRTPVNGPHQGAWVDTPGGENWFLHFQDLGPYGRVVHLEPMAWGADGWPQLGAPGQPGEPGEPVLTHRKPAGPAAAVAVPATSDEFDGAAPGLQWQWQANPAPAWRSLAARPGWLRLTPQPRPAAGSLYLSPNLLLQKFPAPAFTVTTWLDLGSGKTGDAAGLLVFGYDYAWVGLQRSAAAVELVMVTNAGAAQEHRETVQVTLPLPAARVALRVEVRPGARCQFGYSPDGNEFRPVGPEFPASVGRWVGAKVGLFAVSAGSAPSAGGAEFDWFRVTGPAR